MPTQTVNPYLFFEGNCAEAMRFYERVLGGKIDMMMKVGDSPAKEHMLKESYGQILHASLLVDGNHIMASDWMSAEQPFPGRHGFSVSLSYPTADRARKIFEALADSGQVTMPFGKTFWSDGFGMLIDRFGTPWMVGSTQPG